MTDGTTDLTGGTGCLEFREEMEERDRKNWREGALDEGFIWPKSCKACMFCADRLAGWPWASEEVEEEIKPFW